MSDMFDNFSQSAPRVAILGAGFGGLAVGMRLAAGGWDVTVVDRLETPGGRATAITTRGHRFDLGPTLLTEPDLLRRLFLDCGEDPDTALSLSASNPLWTIRAPDGRELPISFGDDMTETVRRHAPSDLTGWLQMWRENGVPQKPGTPSDVIARLRRLLPGPRLMSRVERQVKDPQLRMALALPSVFMARNARRTGLDHSLPEILRGGIVGSRGGLGTVAQKMADVIVRRGGMLRLGCEVTAVLDPSPRPGLQLADGEVIRADVVVTACPPVTTSRPQPDETSAFIWHFGTRDTARLWPDVGQHTILSSRDMRANLNQIERGQLPDDPVLHLHRATLADPASAPSGGDTFYVLVPVPHLAHRTPLRWSDAAPVLRNRVMARLDGVIPGFADRIAASLTMTPEDMRDRYLSPHGVAAPRGSRVRGHGPIYNLVSGVSGGLAGAIAGAEALAAALPRRVGVEQV
ncbi:FAD-dependent oxidoreductase [Jannaschia pohangensis]|uniref:Phytoene desaturase n=1 Tax=Jannaschia pohangensis TaxID=390807 RepID=A0A1I3TJP2_9RHOB|nr:FAD-dependent oxidoreductase [Jannaschia pohangensis]SFJ69846.1 phytoene desaturase [Jannaschia pohangensis]